MKEAERVTMRYTVSQKAHPDRIIEDVRKMLSEVEDMAELRLIFVPEYSIEKIKQGISA